MKSSSKSTSLAQRAPGWTIHALVVGGIGLAAYLLYRLANAEQSGAQEVFDTAMTDTTNESDAGMTPFFGLAKPVQGASLSSKYGTRIDPITHIPSFHNGVDYKVPEGTPVLAPGYGKITRITTALDEPVGPNMKQPNGNSVLIDIPRPDGSSIQLVFLHMSRVDVQLGQVVNRNTQLGLSGNTGYTTGPHVHISMTQNHSGKMVDPESVPEVAQALA